VAGFEDERHHRSQSDGQSASHRIKEVVVCAHDHREEHEEWIEAGQEADGQRVGEEH